MSLLFGVFGLFFGFFVSLIIFQRKLKILSKKIEKEKMIELKESFEKDKGNLKGNK